MNAIATKYHHRGAVAACAIALVAITAVGGPAEARQDAGPAPTDVYAHFTPGRFPLTRIDRQLYRWDNNTGAGVAAPLTVPEQ